MAGRIAFALAAMLALTSCSAQTTSQPTVGPAAPPTQNGATSAPSQADTLATRPAPAGTPSLTLPATVPSPAPSAFVCILQVPAQILTDYTPITLVYTGTDAAQCAQYLAAQPTAGNAWEAEHPPAIVSAVPAGSPVCTGTVGGVTLAIYGTAAAQYACSALGLK